MAGEHLFTDYLSRKKLLSVLCPGFPGEAGHFQLMEGDNKTFFFLCFCSLFLLLFTKLSLSQHNSTLILSSPSIFSEVRD